MTAQRPLFLLAATTLALTLTAACSPNTLGNVARPDVLAALERAKQRPLGKRLVVKATDGSSVRIGPRSRLRFELGDGTVTEWITARHLRTSQQGLTEGTAFVASWNEIRLAEVENLSGAKVLVGVVAVAVVVAVIAATLFGDSKGKKGKSKASSASSGSGRKVRSARRARSVRRHPARGRRVRGRRARGGRRVAGRRHRRHRRRSGPRYIVRAGVRILIAAGAEAGGPPPTSGPSGTGAVARAGEQPTPVELPLSATTPLFSATARRRSSYRFFASASVGTDFRSTDGLSDTLAVGIRFAELFELGAGFRHMLVDHRLDPTGSQTAKDSSYVGFLRIGLHIDLDAGRYFAVPLSIDVGVGDPLDVQWKLNWGFRVRPVDWMWIGVYPFSPTYTAYKGSKRLGNADKWSFPTSVEIGFAF